MRAWRAGSCVNGWRSLSAIAALIGSAVAATACGTDGANAVAPPPRVVVEVMDCQNAPVAGARVALAGQQQVTDSRGRARFHEEIGAGRIVAQVDADGFAPATAVAELDEGTRGQLDVVLLHRDAPISFDTGVNEVRESAGVRVEIPAGVLGYVDDNGDMQTATGKAEIRFGVPSGAACETMPMPGPLEGIQAAGGDAVPLALIALAEISFWQGSTPLNVMKGAKGVTVEIPIVVPKGQVPQEYTETSVEVPTWSFDDNSGYWIEESKGTMQPSSSDPSKLVWRGEVHHFTWWGVHIPKPQQYCYDVFVKDLTGAGVPHQPVAAQGVTYVGMTLGKFTKNAGPNVGHACVVVPIGETATIFLGYPLDPFQPMPQLSQTVTAGSVPHTCAPQGVPCEGYVEFIKPGIQCDKYGDTRPCPGVCTTGQQECGVDLLWGPCDSLEVTAEVCDNKDNDCNGFVDENAPDTIQGDCKKIECKNGAESVVPDPTDYDDGNPCTNDSCIGDMPEHPPFADTKTECVTDDDYHGYCFSGVCVSCFNEIQDGPETGINCGGPCGPCQP